MILGIISFLFGILLLQQFSFLPELYWCWALVSVFSLPFIPKHFHITKKLILFAVGFLWALLRAHWVLDIALPTEFQGKDILVSGVVSSIPVEDKDKRRFEFDIETFEFNKKDYPSIGKVRISWYAKRGSRNNIRIKAGQRWQFWLRLKQPHGFMNPGGFDYEGWLYQKKIRATGYVRINSKKKQLAKKLDNKANGYALLTLRQSLYDKLKAVNATTDYGGILIALAMGEKTGITAEQWQVFRATGINHLVAISGLHIGLLAGFIFILVRKLWPYCGTAALVLASPRVAAISALIGSSFYAALSGFAVPSQRALIMLTIVMLSIFWRHKVQSSQVLSLALLSVLLLDPNAVLSPGFWLSFAAVAIIGIAAFGRLKLDKNWKVWGRLQWRISLALIPLLIFLFQQASLISPIANLFAIPLVSFIVVPLVLLSSSVVSFFPDFSIMLFGLADSTFSILWGFLAYVANTPFSQWYAAKPDVLSLFLASLGFILLLAPKGWPARYFGFFLVIPLMWPGSQAPNKGAVVVTLLDVGQGLAAVVQTSHHALLFDTGAKFNDRFDTGAAVVLPFLREKNIKKLDMLIISHKDNDHSGGLKSIQSNIHVNKLLSSYPLQGGERCLSGQSWEWDGIFFEILNPDDSIGYTKRNNASCVLRVSKGTKALLLTADIEKKAEKSLLKNQNKQLKSTYLIAPHHGSKTSSSQAFLDAVDPDYILIPVGFRNRYRMPHSSVLQRYQARHSPIFESYKSGAIAVSFGEKSSNEIPDEYRKERRKYWNSHH